MRNSIPVEEFKERLSKIRNGMRHRNLDALFIYSRKRSHVAYVSGYRPNYYTNSAIVVLPLDGEPVLWIKFPFDLRRARAMSWFSDIRASVSEEQERIVSQCAEAIRAYGLERSRIGLVGTDLAVDELSFSLYQDISRHLPQVRLEPSSDLLNEARLIKSENEIAALRAATQLAELVADQFRKAIQPGVKDHVATVSAEQAARMEGAEDCSIILSTSPSRMAVPPAGYQFNRGDGVTCEITVQHHGYWVQICRVFSIGKPTPEQKQIFTACRNAYEAAAVAATPGNTVGASAEAAQRATVEAGFKDYIQYGTGHGVGLDLPELYPLEPQCKDMLSPGMVLVIHPAIWVPGKGTAFVGGPVVVSDGRAVRLDTPQSEIIEI